jgi:hypothetical protein
MYEKKKLEANGTTHNKRGCLEQFRALNFNMKIYAFDVDDTLEVSGGPISIASVSSLKPQGHIVGLNGNWAVVVQTVPLWHRIFSFAVPWKCRRIPF